MSLFVSLLSMSAEDRRMLLELGELLAKTNGRYHEYLAMEIGMLRDLVISDGVLLGDARGGAGGRVISFPLIAAIVEGVE